MSIYLMRILILVLYGLLISINQFASPPQINGKVIDLSTNKVLPLATVSIENYGVLTDEEGRFTIETKGLEDADTLTIRFLGYAILRRSLADLKQDEHCYMIPSSVALNEVVVTPLNAESILRIAYDSFFVNHVHENISTRGFYREQFFEGNRCIRMGEAVFDTYVVKTEKGEEGRLLPYLARSIEDSSFLERFNYVFNSRRYVIPLGIDEYFTGESDDGESIQKNHEALGEILFDKKMGFEFTYNLGEDMLISNRKNYVINFKVHKKKNLISQGRFIVDQGTYGLAAFEVKFNEDENLTNMLIPLRFRIIMKIFGFQAEIQGFEAKIYNRFDDGKWFLNNGYQVMRGGIAKQKQWFRGKVMHEFYAFQNQAIPKSDKIEFVDVRTNEFDPAFWKDFPFSPLQDHHQSNIAAIRANNRQFQGQVISKRVYEKYQEKKLKKSLKK